MVKHTQTIRQLLPTNCLSAFNHFVGLEIKGLIWNCIIFRKVIINIDCSNTSGPDCNPVLVLKNCTAKLSYILNDLFNMGLKGSYIPDCWKVSSVSFIFLNVGERTTAKKLPSFEETLKNLQRINFLINFSVVNFLIFSMVLNFLLVQLQIF